MPSDAINKTLQLTAIIPNGVGLVIVCEPKGQDGKLAMTATGTDSVVCLAKALCCIRRAIGVLSEGTGIDKNTIGEVVAKLSQSMDQDADVESVSIVEPKAGQG